MEDIDLQPISDAEQAAFCVELAKRLNKLRRQDHLCDITLMTKYDKTFKAHSNVLSAASLFFCKLLQSNIYTGNVEITENYSK